MVHAPMLLAAHRTHADSAVVEQLSGRFVHIRLLDSCICASDSRPMLLRKLYLRARVSRTKHFCGNTTLVSFDDMAMFSLGGRNKIRLLMEPLT